MQAVYTIEMNNYKENYINHTNDNEREARARPLPEPHH